MSTTDSMLDLGTDPGATVQVARQPILRTDHGQRLHGYQLLFSDSGGLFDVFADVDDVRATVEVVGHTVLTLGVHRVVGDALAFVRFPRAQFMDQTPLVLPPDQSVVQLGPDTWGEVDPDVLSRTCAAYRARGYRIGLVDFVPSEAIRPVLDHCDYVSVDVADKDEARLALALKVLRRTGAATIATSVDDEDLRHLVVCAGADFAQGFYFSAPGVVAGRELPGFRPSYVHLLRTTYADDVDFHDVAEIIKRDVSLSYKLLKYVNSAHFGLRGEVTSVMHAVTMLGLRGIRRWVGLATISGMVHPRTAELAVLAATRARFCESLGHGLGIGSSHGCFALGMFSLLDVMLGQTMAEALGDVPLGDDVIAALQGEPGPMADLVQITIAYERGAWDAVSHMCRDRGWPETDLIGHYIDAAEWSRDIFGSVT